MNYTEFKVLYSRMKNPEFNQGQLAKKADISLGMASDALKALRQRGLLGETDVVTEAGIEALQPYKVENAIIMAAGLSSRFAPISYEHPAGALKVRGEVLIERQIKQLQEAGVDDITVVVGYKKEEFSYLEDLLGVKVVVNDEYAARDNSSTIKKVEGQLGNTFICSSDGYFTVNPFDEYVYGSYCASVFQEGSSSKHCLRTKGKDDVIVAVETGGTDSWVMLGHAYWDKTFASDFVKILDEVYDRAETAGKSWEDIYAEHTRELPMRLRKYSKDDLWKFDSLEELRAFDPEFMENVDSRILDNICAVLECKRADVRNCVPIKQGLTNLSVKFAVDGVSYVYRHPGAGTDEIINRESETFSQEVARELGVDRTFVFEDSKSGWKISRFIEDCVEFDYHNDAHVDGAMELARKLHSSSAQSPWKFDVYQNAIEIMDMLEDVSFPDFEKLVKGAAQLNDFVKADGVPSVLCHNDFYGPNFLVHEDGIDLIDWEYSAMSDYASDLGTFVCCSDYTIAEAERVMEKYFQRTPTPEEMRHCMAYVALCSFYWFVWALYKDKAGDPVGEWLYLWHRAAKTFGARARSLYEEDAAIKRGAAWE